MTHSSEMNQSNGFIPASLAIIYVYFLFDERTDLKIELKQKMEEDVCIGLLWCFSVSSNKITYSDPTLTVPPVDF